MNDSAQMVRAVRLPRRTVAGFALGSFGTGIYSTVPTVLLLYYCTEILRIPAAGAALAVFLPKAWAIFWDPMVGNWSDRASTRLGRRRPFLLAGAVGVSISFVVLFHAPHAGQAATACFVIGAYFVLATVYSLFAVPYIAIPADIGSHPVERERLVAWRMTLAMMGVLLGAGVAPQLVSLAGGGRDGFGAMSVILGAVAGFGMFAAVVSVRSCERIAGTPQAWPAAARQTSSAARPAMLGAILRNRPYRQLAAAYVLQLAGAGLLSATTPYFVTQVLGRSTGTSGTLLGALLVVTICSIPLWSRAVSRGMEYRAIAIAALLYGASCMVLGLLAPAQSAWTALIAFAWLGVPFAGLQLLPFMLLARIANSDAAVTGQHREGLFTGAWTAAEKLGLALGPAAAGLALSTLKHVSGATVQSPATVHGIQALIAFGPGVFMLASLFLLPALFRVE